MVSTLEITQEESFVFGKTLNFFWYFINFKHWLFGVGLLAGFTNNIQGLVSLADHQIRRFSLENRGFALGVSGGADSIALFWVFLDLFKQKKISDLVVFHINFGLRGPESDRDERFVRSICGQTAVACDVFQPPPPHHPQSGVQEFARDFRRSIQANYLAKGLINTLAHNADDVTENILMRLARGSAPENAAGMSYFSDQILRPFLDVSRADIRDRLQRAGINWCEDSSNLTDQYTRNKIRHDVLPVLESLYPGCSKRIAASFLGITQSRSSAFDGPKATRLPLSQLRQGAVQTMSLEIHNFLTNVYGGRSPVSRDVIDQVTRTALRMTSGLDGQSRQFHLPGGLTLLVTSTELHVFQRE
jgi:tRNA(Ile)-lysidine synthetase-like protein